MNNSALNELELLERKLISVLSRCSLESVLLRIHKAEDEIPDFFFQMGMVSFAVRHCFLGNKTKNHNIIKEDWFNIIKKLSRRYFIADPLGEANNCDKNIAFSVQRIVGNQNILNFRIYGVYSRTLKLFIDIPKRLSERTDIKKFDIKSNFQKLNHSSIREFIQLSFTAYAAASSQPYGAFLRNYFDLSEQQGIELPPDKTRKRILGNITSYPKKFIDTFESRKNKDRRFALYDFNPLFMFPLIRPWPKKAKSNPAKEDRIIVPIPKLVLYRSTTGIYYQLFNHFGEAFSSYFGYIFESYIGEILEHSVKKGELISEDEFKNNNKTYKGKIPDWIIIQGDSVVLFECKATKLNRTALSTGSEKAINDSFTQIRKAFKQLSEFTKYLNKEGKSSKLFAKCKKIKSFIVTLESFGVLSSSLNDPYIEYIFNEDKIELSDWRFITMENLEILQPFLATGLRYEDIFEEIHEKGFEEVQTELEQRTGKTHRDSFLDKPFEDMIEKMTQNARKD